MSLEPCEWKYEKGKKDTELFYRNLSNPQLDEHQNKIGATPFKNFLNHS